ncbi:polysaccharide biosynthesis/export family protein [Cypionkella sp.]|uniref:polysaccharide biosynthesis/export family protein n=1 Tax=Cypionkella sp. TaxID=2811411 RepID=UPI000BD2805B|nr:polysaccharide biosynthesis/export family protein [Cypionkella sp.]MDO8982392.1 polysaccharide biosynthesis/export family protein [Cypionkella sp.]MDP2050643.1 polysaccharide biosynthesis/export family protein [Cypionkella sp.]OZA20052.1 MAG: sugar ABC transporter substrate-binding protein [Rhodobacterales bacterium 17-64-5]
MRGLIFASVCMALASCTDGFTTFPVSQGAQQALTENVTIVRLDAANIARFSRSARGPQSTSLRASTNWEYKVGTGDILSIIVFEQPELTLASGPVPSAAQSGFSVQADGAFFFPYIGQVQARGRVIEDIRIEVAKRLAEFFPDPQVEVRISQFNSQRVNVAGEVKQPNRQALNTVALTLLEAVSAAGGMTETADPTRITLQRSGKVYPIDLKAFLEHGYAPNNPVMHDGDIITVPRRQTEEAYLLGEVVRPATVDLSLEPVTLTQALTRQGGVDGLRADARGVFVFRSVGAQMMVFQLETASPVGLLLGTRFVLSAGDVVYVTRSPLQRWNDTISRLLPTVQATAAANSIGN